MSSHLNKKSHPNSGASSLDKESECRLLEESFDRTLAIRSRKLSVNVRPLAGLSVTQLRADVSPERFDPQVNPTKHSLLITSNTVDSEMEIDGRAKRSIFTPGDVSLVPRGCVTNGYCHTPSEFTHLLVEEPCLEEIRDETDGPSRLELVPILQSRDELLRQLAGTLVAELSKEPAFDRLYVEILSRAIVAHIIKTFGASGPIAREAYPLPTNLVGMVFEYVAENLGGNILLEDLATVTGVNASRLHRQFKKATGQPLHQYVMGQRVKRARELLSSSKLSVAEIAYVTGFADQSHLTRVMRQHTGLTPKAFRIS